MDEATQIAALRARISELEEQVEVGRRDAELSKAVLAAMPIFVVRVSPALRIQYINRLARGLTREDVLGGDVREWVESAHREVVKDAIEKAIATQTPQRYELLGQGDNGEVRHYLTRVVPSQDEQGERCAVLVSFDITELREQEQALRESEESLRLVLDVTRLGLWSWDVASDKVTWNEHMFQLCGTETPATPTEYIKLVHPEDRGLIEQNIQETLRAGTFHSFEHRIVRPDGQVRWCIAFGKVLHDPGGKMAKIIGGTLDITEQRSTAEQLRHAQKMEALGQLTAGVAHNFNNMLSIILPTLQILERSVPEDRRLLLRGALDAGQRATELVQNMVRFAREPSMSRRHVLSVEDLARHAVDICRRVFDTAISLEERYEAPGALIKASGSDIEQTLVNLLINARDALELTPSPRILVELTRPDERHVQIRITDNGPGIPDAIRERLFEPFFTTKDPGRGTGLGLATAYATLRDHDGTILLDSSSNGASFVLRLPLWLGAAPPATPSIPPLPRPSLPGWKILLVDDEEPVRRTLSWLLEEAGYRCSFAASAAEAIAVLEASPGVHLILLDRSMPGGLSPAEILRLQELAPGCRLLLHTGQPPPPSLARLVDGVLLKPASRELLLERIAALLEGSARPAA
jgi:PAS domain S-box-containing protein